MAHRVRTSRAWPVTGQAPGRDGISRVFLALMV
jgi:hypothetical protein